MPGVHTSHVRRGAALLIAIALSGSVWTLAGAPTAETVTPFRIHVSDAVLADLRTRLDRTRLPDEIDAAGWDYGTSTAYLKTLLAYWRNGYNWRAEERKLNQFAHFKTTIEGI